MKARIRLMAGVLMAVCVLAACRDEMPDMQNPCPICRIRGLI